MKIATYNIWNSDINYSKRINLLVSSLKNEEIDILVLQEVRDSKVIMQIKSECQFDDYYWKEYFDCTEGLAILSKYPIINSWTNWDNTEEVHNSGIMNVSLNLEGSITLDFNNNPRWDHEHTLEIPGRFDWIMLKNPYPKKCPKLIDFKLIGNQRTNGITPSDHYGVLCNIEF